CLRSVYEAKTNIPFTLYLIDNNSRQDEWESIQSYFEHINNHVTPEKKFEWIRNDANLGFAGGNNIGFKKFLDNALYSDICLLNSDTIVTDNWLEGLVLKNADAIGPVTNA